MRSTTGESTGGIASAIAGTPCVVGEHVQSRFSLIVIGTPWNGPSGSPAATAASAASAPALAPSASTRTTALRFPFTSSMRARWASTTSRLEVSPPAIIVASSFAARVHSSLVMVATYAAR